MGSFDRFHGVRTRGHRDNHGEPTRVGEADGDFRHAQPFGATAGPAVEARAGRAAGSADHLHIAPADAAKPGAERFHYRLFGRETRRQVGRAAPAIGDFPGGEHTTQEPIAVPVQDTGHAVYLNKVNASGEHGRSAARPDQSPPWPPMCRSLRMCDTE